MQNLNMRFDLVQVSFIDDAVGGSVETGTVVARSIPGVLDIDVPTQAALEQGLEVSRVGTICLRPLPGSLTGVIRERDQLVVVAPSDHPEINQFWRVEGADETAGPMHPKNRKRFINIKATRVERTRVEVLQ